MNITTKTLHLTEEIRPLNSTLGWEVLLTFRDEEGETLQRAKVKVNVSSYAENESAKLLFWTSAGWSEIAQLSEKSALAKDRESWTRWGREDAPSVHAEARAIASSLLGQLVNIGKEFLA
jgi:hypothetical protein